LPLSAAEFPFKFGGIAVSARNFSNEMKDRKEDGRGELYFLF